MKISTRKKKIKEQHRIAGYLMETLQFDKTYDAYQSISVHFCFLSFLSRLILRLDSIARENFSEQR